MPEVVLVYGEHNNETEVTEYVARRLQAFFSRIKVSSRLLQVPKRTSLYGQLEVAKAGQRERRAHYEESMERLEHMLGGKENQIVLVLHSRPADTTTLDKTYSGRIPPKEIEVLQHRITEDRHTNIFTVEIPAVFVSAQKNPRLEQALDPHLWQDLYYVRYKADLKATLRRRLITLKQIKELGTVILNAKVEVAKPRYPLLREGLMYFVKPTPKRPAKQRRMH